MKPQDVNDEWSFLDFLDDRNCWYNDLNERRPAHMDSYMTLPDYTNIYKAIQELSLSKKLWKNIIEYCKSFAYLSPNSAILAIILKHKIFPDNA